MVTKVLVDGGAGLNLISPAVIERLQIPDGDLEETGTFQGVNPGRSQPKGKITLPVTFGGELNYRMEKIVFDVAQIPLPYNGILGRPALAKFMAASHYAYNTLRMPGPMSIITVTSDKKYALICADQLYREAVAATAAKALAPAAVAPGGKKAGKTSSGKTSRTNSNIPDIMTPGRLSPPWNSFPAADTHHNGITIIDSADEPEEYTVPQERSHSFVSAYVMDCLILPVTLSSCSPIRLQVRSKLILKLEFLNGCGVHIGAAINTIYLLSS